MFVEIVNKLDATLNRKGINLIFETAPDVPSKVISDRLLLGEVLLDLLDNAIAFTEEGNIWLNVIRLPTEKDEVRLRFDVMDTGVGIHHEALQDILIPFCQDKIESLEEIGLSGKGLYRIREILKKMDGQLSIESLEGHGSTFSAEVSLHAADINEQRHYRLPSIKALSLKVLIFEDNEEQAKVLKKFLEYFHHDVEILNIRHIHIELMKTAAYDIVFISQKLIHQKLEALLLQLKSKSSIKLVLIENMIIKSQNNISALKIVDQLIYKPYNQQSVYDLLLRLYDDEAQMSSATDLEITVSVKNKLMAQKGVSEYSTDILLIEPYEGIQNTILDIAGKKLISVQIAEYANEVESLLNKLPALKLILLDMDIVKTGAYAVLKKIKSNPNSHNIPIIVMMHKTFPETLKPADDVGVEGYLQMPFQPSNMIRLIDKYCSV